MGENSKIEWTDHTFNPWIGCQKVSDGCKFCYAERDFTRKPRWANTWGPSETTERIRTSDANWRKPLVWNEQAKADGRRAKVFCASLADVFEDNPQVDEWRADVWDLIELTPNLDWLLLTKRPENVIGMTNRWTNEGWLSNVWLGVSCEDQIAADKRIPCLLRIPAAVRFVSAEPLLAPLNLYEATGLKDNLNGRYTLGQSLDWLIVGCESGPHRRPMQLDWARALVEQCREAGVAVFVKQLDIDGRVSKDPGEWPEDLRIREFPL